jgi:drug/metabolite transporter (DMT)-like permease
MRSVMVVIRPPCFDLALGICDRQELIRVQAFIAQLAVEGFDKAVFNRLSVAAAGVETLGLLAYNQGLKVTSSLIINATTTAIVLIVGFLALNEPVSGVRLCAIGLIAAGMFLLNAQGV